MVNSWSLFSGDLIFPLLWVLPSFFSYWNFAGTQLDEPYKMASILLDVFRCEKYSKKGYGTPTPTFVCLKVLRSLAD